MAAKKKQVTLHVPSAPFRPGDKASFAPFENEPGDLPRPDPVKCTAAETTDHAYGLVRVLDSNGKASGPWNPELTPDELLKIVDPYQSYLALHIWRHKD